MENYIVIILMVIIFIASTVGKSKEKVILQQQNTEPDTPDNNRDTISESGTVQSVYQPAYNFVKNRGSMKAPEEDNFYSFTPKEEGGSVSRDSISNKESNIKQTVKDIKARKFSLKKAVIYSEILNRKYI